MKEIKCLSAIVLIAIIVVALSGCIGKNTAKINKTENPTIVESEPFVLANAGFGNGPEFFLVVEMLGHEDISDMTGFRSHFALLKITTRDIQNRIVNILLQENINTGESREVKFNGQNIKITLDRINAIYQSNSMAQSYIKKVTADITVEYSNIEGN